MPAAVTFNDVRYASLAAAAVAHGLDAATVAGRVRRGWSVAAALETPPTKRGRPIQVAGNTFGSREEARAAAGLAESTVRARITRGLSLQDAIGMGKQPRGRRPGTLRVTAIAAGINPDVVRARLRIGWTLARSLAVPPKRYRSKAATSD